MISREQIWEEAVAEAGQPKGALRPSQEGLWRAVEAARMVAREWNIGSDEVAFSPNAAEVLGAPLPATRTSFTRDWVHLEDRSRQRAATDAALAKGGNYVSQFRITRPDNGAVAWLENHAVAWPRSSG